MFRILSRAAAYRSAAATAALLLGAGLPAVAGAQAARTDIAAAPTSGFAMTDATDTPACFATSLICAIGLSQDQ